MADKKQIKYMSFLLCALLLLSNTLTADNKMLFIVNSDDSVEKYNEVRDEFKKASAYPVTEINLNDKKWDDSAVESLFSDKNPNLIYCIGTKAYLTASRYAKETDIVFSSVINWLRLPLTQKTYGVSTELHTGMQMTLFRYVFPDIKKIGILYGKEYNSEWVIKAKEEAKGTDIKIIDREVSDSKGAISSLKELLPDIDAFWLIADPVVMADKNSVLDILKLTDSQKKPVFSYHEVFVKYGAVMIVSADNSTIGRQAAGIASEALEKNKPSEKVQFPAGSHIILNLKKAKEYGLKYSADAFSVVNEIIE